MPGKRNVAKRIAEKLGVEKRGSEKLLMAWKNRGLTDEAVDEIATELDRSPARIEKVNVVGGQMATGVSILLSYQGDDMPWCGNDLAFWLRWRLRFGGVSKPPRIIIKGIPVPDLVQMQLDFGHFDEVGNPPLDLMGEFEMKP